MYRFIFSSPFLLLSLVALTQIVTLQHLYFVSLYNHTLLIDKDLCKCQKMSINYPVSFIRIFLFLCYLYISILHLYMVGPFFSFPFMFILF